jgi:hypothetical protein
MGVKLLGYYKYVSDQAGVGGKVKLAQETKIPSTRAAMMPDAEPHLSLFRAAVATVTGKPAPTL